MSPGMTPPRRASPVDLLATRSNDHRSVCWRGRRSPPQMLTVRGDDQPDFEVWKEDARLKSDRHRSRLPQLQLAALRVHDVGEAAVRLVVEHLDRHDTMLGASCEHAI